VLYQHLTDACFEEQLGSHGVSHKRIEALLSQLGDAFTALKTRRNKDAVALLELPSRTDDLAAIQKLAEEIRSKYETVVVAGMGGSSLSGRTLTSLAPLGTKPVFHFLENIDPDLMDEMLEHIDCKKTCFLVISKSGSTAETLAQFFVLWDYAVKKLGKQAAQHFFAITMPGDNPTRRFANKQGMTVLDHEPIGGRFAILTNIGLLPAAIVGLDIKALRRGAKMVVEQIEKSSQPKDCPPALGAALHAAFMEKNYAISVMLPYAARFKVLSAWWRQCWAESLGKHGKGSTPVCAVGTTDQHSQLQLYLDGPRDKFFHMVMLERKGTGRLVAGDSVSELAYLQNKTLGDIMEAEQKATFETLTRHHCPVRLFKFDRLGEEQVGAILMHFMLEVIFTSHLLGVTPFDQPAVEEGKKLAKEYLLAGKL